MDELFAVVPSDKEVKEQVNIVMNIGRRTIEESFKLGGMLIAKKEEKGHGNWLPFLEEINLSHSVAKRLMTAFREQDSLIEGMTYSELVKHSNSPNGTISKHEPDPFEGWSNEEKELQKKWKAGDTILINMDTHKHLVRYASDLQVYTRIDRGTAWGNPFLEGSDGTRDEVCDWYAEHYMPFKRSLLSRVNDLKGRVLGCHCYPQRCHGDHLIELTNGDN